MISFTLSGTTETSCINETKTNNTNLTVSILMMILCKDEIPFPRDYIFNYCQGKTKPIAFM